MIEQCQPSVFCFHQLTPCHLRFYICRSSPHGSALRSGYLPVASEARYSQMQTHRYYIHRTPASLFRYNPLPEMHHAFYPQNYPMYHTLGSAGSLCAAYRDKRTPEQNHLAPTATYRNASVIPYESSHTDFSAPDLSPVLRISHTFTRSSAPVSANPASG